MDEDMNESQINDSQTNEPFLSRCGDTTPQDSRNTIRLLGTILIWAICFVGASLIIKRELLPEGPMLWLLAILPSIAAAVVWLTYSRFLREADELQQKIQLQGLALGFGAGWFALCGYPIFEPLGAPVLEAGDYVVVLAVFYSLGIMLGLRRYC